MPGHRCDRASLAKISGKRFTCSVVEPIQLMQISLLASVGRCEGPPKAGLLRFWSQRPDTGLPICRAVDHEALRVGDLRG
jgi:hypothetical protein